MLRETRRAPRSRDAPPGPVHLKVEEQQPGRAVQPLRPQDDLEGIQAVVELATVLMAIADCP
eukprot:5961897-Lingulodinium_polyedra.AAC.1